MFVVTDAEQWAQENCGSCDLRDKRRDARLVRMAGDLARHAGWSLLKSCDGDEAAAEGMVGLLRNEQVDPSAIAEGGFEAAARRARGCALLLLGQSLPFAFHSFVDARRKGLAHGLASGEAGVGYQACCCATTSLRRQRYHSR